MGGHAGAIIGIGLDTLYLSAAVNKVVVVCCRQPGRILAIASHTVQGETLSLV